MVVVMPSKRAQSCGCGYTLSTGMSLFAALNLIMGIVMLSTAAFPMPQDWMSKEHKDFFSNNPDYKTMMSVGGAVHLVVGIVFLTAALSKSAFFAKVAIFAVSLSIIMDLALIIVRFYWGRGIMLVINAYFCYIAWSFHELLKEEDKITMPASAMPATSVGMAGYRP
ncbi:Uncharacterized protein PBTT_03727 [Plasmodiophora brassicae]